MTDGFIEYDPNSFNLSSPPSHFSMQFMDDYIRHEYEQPGEQNIPMYQVHPQKLEESPENRFIDALSIDSNSSTNYSSKQSPEYTENQECHSDSIRKGDEDFLNQPRLPQILKKGIQKPFDPIMDNNLVYKYEDDPNEYKKARKRIQNRESASRIRSKKKNHMEDLEGEVYILRTENSNLRVEIATLKAENNLLKQQTCFLEKMVMKAGQQAMTNTPTHNLDHDFEECLLPLVNKAEEKSTNKRLGYFRVAPPHTFKKHAAVLSLFTILICSYGFLGQTNDKGVEFNYPRTLDEFQSMPIMSVKNVDEYSSVGGVPPLNGGRQMNFDLSLKALVKANQEYNTVKLIIKVAVVLGYVTYLIYVLLVTNWKYIFRIKNFIFDMYLFFLVVFIIVFLSLVIQKFIKETPEQWNKDSEFGWGSQ